MSFNPQSAVVLTMTRVLIAAATVLLIIGTGKLTVFALWVQGFSDFEQQAIHNTSVNFIHLQYTSHLVALVSRLPFLVMTYSTFATSCFRKMLWVNLRGWGGSNIAVIS